MCGIVGFIDTKAATPNRGLVDLVRSMSNCMRHRGPDDSGEWVDQRYGVAFGHRRLAVIDLSPCGHQPMVSHCGRYILIFNGEIYNYRDLRARLGDRYSIKWQGNSDTEVLLAAVSHWGIRHTLDEIEGMFAFAVWDRARAELHLARDRMGEKPLYYGWQGSTFFFCSELKALFPHPDFQGKIDREAFQLYTLKNHIPSPHCIFSGLKKLPPGSSLSLSPSIPGHQPDTTRYWSLIDFIIETREKPFDGSLEQAADELETILSDVIERQSYADVPLGAFLSGGIDSSIVTALLAARSGSKVKTFTIGFVEKEYNEIEYAREIAGHLETEHTELVATANDSLDYIDSLPTIYDEPFADSSQLPTLILSFLTRQYVTVGISGDGGDEMFGGYPNYRTMDRYLRLTRFVPRLLRSGFAALLHRIPCSWLKALARSMPPLRRHAGTICVKAERMAAMLPGRSALDTFARLTSNWFLGKSLLEPAVIVDHGIDSRISLSLARSVTETLMACDATHYLPDDILAKVDRASMAASLETRIPLLNHRVVEFAFRLPLEYKYSNGRGKIILREILRRHLPDHLFARPKSGFSVPIGQWLRTDLRDWAENLLDEKRLRSGGFYRPSAIAGMWRKHLSEKVDYKSRLWNVLMFQQWQEVHRSVLNKARGSL